MNKGLMRPKENTVFIGFVGWWFENYSNQNSERMVQITSPLSDFWNDSLDDIGIEHNI